MALSPMMRQYLEIKEQYSDAILFFRLGDFYEMFFDDAKLVSRELDLTLTGRDCGEDERAPMCGVPYHSADTYIGRLINKGYKVVICEQTEDPTLAKGLVKREVVRIITPGTMTDVNQLDENKNNFISSVYIGDDVCAVCFADISTGDISASRIEGKTLIDRIKNELSTYTPKEIIFNTDLSKYGSLCEYIENSLNAMTDDKSAYRFEFSNAKKAFETQFANEIDTRDSANFPIVCAVGALIGYIKETQKIDLSYIKNLKIYSTSQYLEMDASTRRNLELCETMRKEKRGTLLWVLDNTLTSMGARLLRRSIEMPLVDIKQIEARLSAVEALTSDFMIREELSLQLREVLDLERLMTKVVYNTAGPKDLRAICQTIKVLPNIKEILNKTGNKELIEISEAIDPLCDIFELIDNAIVPDPPFSPREGKFIKAGYNADVDKFREILTSSNDYLKKIEAAEKEKTGIKNLKIGYNRVFGYYIEVSKSNINDVPDYYIRKQTLTNGERYITKELKEMEITILGAEDKDNALEYELFCNICKVLCENVGRIQNAASCIAKVDMFLSLATAAVKNNYVRPEITYDDVIDIKEGRHPVVEKFATDSYFVPNDAYLDTNENKLLIITGPNMAGKSTFMRQVALICIMAQIGSFVPATQARLGIIDKLFTRIGASDDIASGQSTFMLEMNEVAYILKNATRRSLIIYDEIGRGTSTFDGMSIARAVAEYTATKICAKTLFATHYHELTDMESKLQGVKNFNIVAKKKGDTVTFLRKIVRGAADDSYGIEVAKLAGIPSDIIKRAREILKTLEGEASEKDTVFAARKKETKDFDLINMSIDDYISNEINEKIKAVDIDTLTPIEALNFIYELKKMQK